MPGCEDSAAQAGPSCIASSISLPSPERSTTFGPSRRTRSFRSPTSRRSWDCLATEPFDCFAIAAPGLEPIVARELNALGERPRIEDGGVSWRGDAHSMMRANLWLRAASRVIIRLAQFRATAFFELEKRAKRIPWSQFLAPGQAAEFRVTAKKSRLYHSDAIAERLQKAVGFGLWAQGKSSQRKAQGPQPVAYSPPRAHSPQLFVVRVFHDDFTISVDTSGELLHMRGYRQAVGKAPLRETLAAALLLAADWDGTAPLLDPFCGSGTIPIEAALIARRMAPGLQRRFAFMEWPNFDAKVWRRLTEAAKNAALASSPALILGSDRDAGAIAASRANSERAGVSADIEFQTRAISAIEPPATPGLVATNPPYAVRVGEGSTIRNLYARFGQVLRTRCSSWRTAFYSPDPRLAAEIGHPFLELFRTTNGGIKVAALLVDAATNGLERP